MISPKSGLWFWIHKMSFEKNLVDRSYQGRMQTASVLQSAASVRAKKALLPRSRDQQNENPIFCQKRLFVLDPHNIIPTKLVSCQQSGFWFWIHKMSFQQNPVSRQKLLLVLNSQMLLQLNTVYRQKQPNPNFFKPTFWLWIHKMSSCQISRM